MFEQRDHQQSPPARATSTHANARATAGAAGTFSAVPSTARDDPLAATLARAVQQRGGAGGLLQRTIRVANATWTAAEIQDMDSNFVSNLQSWVGTYCAQNNAGQRYEAILSQILTWINDPTAHPTTPQPRKRGRRMAYLDPKAVCAAADAAVLAATPVAGPIPLVRTPLPTTLEEGAARRYTIELTGSANDFLSREAEKQFLAYAKGMSVADGVGELLAAFQRDKDIQMRTQYCRHDIQDSRPEVVNLQIQLGGSKAFRVGKGDTSASAVVLDLPVYTALATDDALLRAIIVLGHRRSFAEGKIVNLKSLPTVTPTPTGGAKKKKKVGKGR